VFVKVGGLGMPKAGFDAALRPQPPSSEELAGLWRPYVETCIEAFGAQRCMFESDFPPDKQTCSYRVIWNVFKRLAAACSTSERAALFHDTAARVYRLPPAR
jgi:predicted TIM-barrel fold metal-dependent hydrolase